MWELDHKEGWMSKNWYFQTVVLEKTLESPWTARRSNPSILKEINPKYSLEGLMLKLKLQYFGHLMARADSLEKTLMLGKIEGMWKKGGNRGWAGWWHHRHQWTWVWANSGRWWTIGKPGMLQSMGSQRTGHYLATEQRQKPALIWKELNAAPALPLEFWGSTAPTQSHLYITFFSIP